METTSTSALVEFTDALTGAEGPNQLVHVLAAHSRALLEVCAVSVLLSAPGGELLRHGVPDEPGFSALFDLQHQVGPEYECYRYGRSVAITIGGAHRLGLPTLADAMATADISVADATPLRVRDRTIGALTVFRTQLNPGPAERRIGDLVRGMASLGAAKLPFDRPPDGSMRLPRARRSQGESIDAESADAGDVVRAG